MNQCDFKLEGFGLTRTVTLLMARVEETGQLFDCPPEEMVAVMALHSGELSDTITAYNGVRLAEHGNGDKFAAAFAQAGDAVACAVALQRIPLAPVQLRIGVHTAEVAQFFAGATVDHAAQLCDFAESGQTVISGVTEDLVHGQLPERRG